LFLRRGRRPELLPAPAAGAAMTASPALAPPPAQHRERLLGTYFCMGVLFGIVLTKGELASWFRIQEALRFKGPYLYEVFASALAVAAPGFALLKRRRARALTGEPIDVPPKRLGSGVRYVAGSVLFGLGWALIGACPGPMFALLIAAVALLHYEIPPVPTWFYVLAWYPTLVVFDQVVVLLGGESLLARPPELAAMLWWSAVIWFLFEAINFRLQNWYYVFLPPHRLDRWAGVIISLATVVPAVLLPERVLDRLGVWHDLRARPV